MAQIFDRGTTWELSIFPNISATEVINEPAKGYRATLGFDPDTQRHVVTKVVYDKDKFTVDEVLKKVETLRDCAECDTLDKSKLQLESINFATPAVPEKVFSLPTGVQGVPALPVPPSASIKPGIKDMFATLVLDAYLTNPGKYFLGMMLDDETLMQSAFPQGTDDMSGFMGEMIDFMSGDVDFMRSPEQAREFMSVLQAPGDTVGVGSTPVKRISGSFPTGNIVIY